MFSSRGRDEQLESKLSELRQRTPAPVFWLFGRTQSGKTSLIRFLTGAQDAEIGEGFKPCTRFSRLYNFPTSEAPLLHFLDTRGMDEPSYDPAEDLAKFDGEAHVIIVTAKVTDHGLERVLRHLRSIRDARPTRPVVLVLTCLHEAYPQQQHPAPYPYVFAAPTIDAVPIGTNLWCRAPGAIPEALARTLAEQCRRFDGLVDHVVPVDLTKPDEGYTEPNYGGDALKGVLLEVLPAVYRHTLIALDEAGRELQDLYMKHALPHILGYSTLAATAGAIPVPWLDLLLLPGIQTRMIYHLARFYGQPLTGTRFLELASTLGIGVLARQAVRELTKFIPVVGSVASAALAGASTFALGKAFCFYYSAVHKGHVPQKEELRRYYQEQLSQAEKLWRAPASTGSAAEAP